ncbi:MAG TPA: PDDEXK nuclease domain-containing protein [Myxococcota bacterium]|nr:PDDEXK nuclease domain-containing protein [Myxococcota bacterium]HRY95624.1 PDDEXK nuclease domain-containing protein [Myxococcota bacterium]HSA20351.1 PDDEXK nuclease domain-containing protein [Myxococcota bacterium]
MTRPGFEGSAEEPSFAEVLELIQKAKWRTLSLVNTALIDLYWQVGEYISRKLESATWGDGSVEALAAYLARRRPGLRGFSRPNLFRMRMFFEVYRDDKKVSTLLRQLPWSSNLHILSKCKRPEEREFYLRMAVEQRWPVRELARQIDGALFERVLLNPPKVSKALKALHPGSPSILRDAYLLEFLDLTEGHREVDLHSGLLRHLRRFLAELGRDFCFVGSEVPLQVGGKDFALDLLFFHRGLNSLVAIELKLCEFQPEHLGKLEFYLEALDRDVRKAHEGPSIGVLLCAGKDDEVVEYALSRAQSPALIAEYQTHLPDKKLLQAKLHELYALTVNGHPG